MIQTITLVSALTGCRLASQTVTAPGFSRPYSRKRKGVHLFMEPNAMISPNGRENSSVSAKSCVAVPRPFKRDRVTDKNMEALL